MTQLAWVPRINASKTIIVTPTISTSIYASGDQLGGIMTLTDAVRQDTNVEFGFSELVEVTILDASIQNAAMDIWLFNQSPTVTSTDNQPFSMSDANQALQCIGWVSVGATASYSASALNSVSTTANLNKPCQVISLKTAPKANPTNLYAIAVVRGTPTYGSTTALQFQFSFFID
jgi:hypothetical protein